LEVIQHNCIFSSAIWNHLNGFISKNRPIRVFIICVCVELPGAPEDLRLSEVTNTLCKLTWNAPEYDGGSPVIGYYVERYIESSWNRINTSSIPECSLSIEWLQTSADEFRVCAVNAFGVGPPSLVITAQPPEKGLSLCLYVELY